MYNLGFRFSRSIRLTKGIRLNLSKSGIGVSARVKGYRVGVGPRGFRTTASIPGTGLSYVKQSNFTHNPYNKVKKPTYRDFDEQQQREVVADNLFGKEKDNSLAILILGIIIDLVYFPVGILITILGIVNLLLPNNIALRKYNNAISKFKANRIDSAIELLVKSIDHNKQKYKPYLLLSMLYHDYKNDYMSTDYSDAV